MACYSNNEACTSSCTCVLTNHVEENKELKAKSLHQTETWKRAMKVKYVDYGKSPQQKEWTWIYLHQQEEVQDQQEEQGLRTGQRSSHFFCFKCKVEGHHVRS
jgi:hypothetical protein